MWCNDSHGKTDRLESVFGKRYILPALHFSGQTQMKADRRNVWNFPLSSSDFSPCST